MLLRRLLPLLVLVPFAAAGDRECTCREGNGSYVFLRCPKAAPDDPDPCPAAANGVHPNKNPPESWNDMCWQLPRMDCFLRRHAVSWNIACSMCLQDKCCPFPNWHNCPECHGEEAPPPPNHEEAMKIAEGQKKIGGKNIELAMSPHFIVVTDIRSLKIASTSGPRIARQHELLHLYLQRAEMARLDFIKVFGSAYSARSAIVLTKSKSLRDKFASTYWGTPATVLRGGGSKTTVDGHASNGTCIDGKSDDDLHFTMRHMIGHLLMSTYLKVEPHRKYLPFWLDNGCAHWLEKLHPRAENFATFCQHEGAGGNGKVGKGGGGIVNGSGARWDDKAKKIARKGPDRDPVEAMFQASTVKEMDYEMHVRSWSWFHTFATEEPEAFKMFVQGLRRAEEARVAAKQAWGQPPEIVDDRWREFVLGKRRDVEATTREREKETDVDAATARELRDIANETDIQLQAGRIRGLERCKNTKTADLLIALTDTQNSARVREVIALVLEATDDSEVLEHLRGKGYDRAGKLGRATLCRVFARKKMKEALPLLRDALDDSFWLVRAQAALALGELGDTDSLDPLTRMASSGSNGKLRIAAMDALGKLGNVAEPAIPMLEKNLMNRNWQVKVAACDTFKAIGSTKAVDSLIGRLDAEGGRVHDDIREALKALTGIDKDWKAETWMEYWKKAKRFAELEKKSQEELEKEGRTPKKTDERKYAEKKPPTYYGIKVYARAVGYVLDISDSMKTGFIVSEEWERRLGHKFNAQTKIGVAKEELVHSIRELDPRTRLNLVFFNDRVRIWKSTPVAAGAMGENAVSAVENIAPSGQTNYFDALRLILGLDEDDSLGWNSSFADTPDTLFFLTDGAPTDGEITKADELLAWFGQRNRFARLRVHVIAMGHTGVDHEFLRKLAEEAGGKYVNLTGTY